MKNNKCNICNYELSILNENHKTVYFCVNCITTDIRFKQALEDQEEMFCSRWPRWFIYLKQFCRRRKIKMSKLTGLFLIFITLKLCHVIDWNWFYIISPFILEIILRFILKLANVKID